MSAVAEKQAPADKALQKRLIFAWLDALRSGEYRKTTGCLENERGNCCLGVACRVAKTLGLPIKPSDPDEDGLVGFYWSECDCVNYTSLPGEMKDALGLMEHLGVPRDGIGRPLYFLNDNGSDFPAIADEIERNAINLFVNGEEVASWIKERKAGAK